MGMGGQCTKEDELGLSVLLGVPPWSRTVGGVRESVLTGEWFAVLLALVRCWFRPWTGPVGHFRALPQVSPAGSNGTTVRRPDSTPT
jgi:hypothetical protein